MGIENHLNGAIHRRRFLQTAGFGIAAATFPAATPSVLRAQTFSRRRVGRIAHLTDVHVQPEHAGEAGFVACLHHMQEHAKPDLVLFGGDGVFDVTDRDAARRDQLGAMWRRVLKADLSTPHRSTIGNHDVPDMRALIASKADADAAKAWPCELYGLDKRYYSFDQFGWHFVVLDSVAVGGRHGYEGKIDVTQLDWLQADLKANAGKPVLVLSHIPIVSVVGFFDGDRTQTGDWDVPSSYVHIDANRLHELFVSAGNVKLCVSGHAHQLDRVTFDGITYGCHGAVCGDWWKGTYKHTPAGYATIDLFDDGAFEIDYLDFGWQAKD